MEFAPIEEDPLDDAEAVLPVLRSVLDCLRRARVSRASLRLEGASWVWVEGRAIFIEANIFSYVTLMCNVVCLLELLN
jgi:hypothetical protein